MLSTAAGSTILQSASFRLNSTKEKKQQTDDDVTAHARRPTVEMYLFLAAFYFISFKRIKLNLSNFDMGNLFQQVLELSLINLIHRV